jgi:hypothetical protein
LKVSDAALSQIADVIIGEAARIASTQGTCGSCGRPLPLNRTGRPAEYCGTRCRQAAFRRRKAVAR